MQFLIKHLEDQKQEVRLGAKSASEQSSGFSSRSKCHKEPQDQTLSESEEEDAVYVPFEYQGDGRKREAKRHKMQTMVAKDEIEIDRMIRDY